MDGPRGIRAFAESMGVDYPILSDESKETARAYGVVTDERVIPFRWTFYIGKDGTILFVDKNVNPGSHGADVVSKLNELGVAKKQ